MKKISFIVLFSLGLLFAISPAALKKELDARYQGLSSFQAHVQQKNYYTQLKREISYQGKLYFTAGRMLMHFDSPNVQRLYIASGRAELFDAASNLLVLSAIQPELSKMNPVEILAYYWDDSAVNVAEDKNGQITVVLKPHKDPAITEISGLIDAKSKLIQSIKYKDRSGNTVQYAFSKIQLNQPIAATVWNYTYPKDVQRITK